MTPCDQTRKVTCVPGFIPLTVETSSLADGFYRVLDLGPGQYRVSVSKTGFQDARQEKVTVGISEAARVDFASLLGFPANGGLPVPAIS